MEEGEEVNKHIPFLLSTVIYKEMFNNPIQTRTHPIYKTINLYSKQAVFPSSSTVTSNIFQQS